MCCRTGFQVARRPPEAQQDIERAALLRSRTQQARVQRRPARRRCGGPRRSHRRGRDVDRRTRPGFTERVRARLEHAAGEVDDAVTEHLAVVAELGLPDEVPAVDRAAAPADPAVASGGLANPV